MQSCHMCFVLGSCLLVKCPINLNWRLTFTWKPTKRPNLGRVGFSFVHYLFCSFSTKMVQLITWSSSFVSICGVLSGGLFATIIWVANMVVIHHARLCQTGMESVPARLRETHELRIRGDRSFIVLESLNCTWSQSRRVGSCFVSILHMGTSWCALFCSTQCRWRYNIISIQYTRQIQRIQHLWQQRWCGIRFHWIKFQIVIFTIF